MLTQTRVVVATRLPPATSTQHAIRPGPYAGPMGLLDLMAGHPAATPHAEALARAERGVAVYWRPGCPFCVRLRIAVRKQRAQIAWVDIWQDDAGRAYVAGVNDGNETVPTVVIDGTPHTNPSPGVVKAALAAH